MCGKWFGVVVFLDMQQGVYGDSPYPHMDCIYYKHYLLAEICNAPLILNKTLGVHFTHSEGKKANNILLYYIINITVAFSVNYAKKKIKIHVNAVTFIVK